MLLERIDPEPAAEDVDESLDLDAMAAELADENDDKAKELANLEAILADSPEEDGAPKPKVMEANDTAEEEDDPDSSGETKDWLTEEPAGNQYSESETEEEEEEDIDPILMKLEDALDPAVKDLETVGAAIAEAEDTS
eukprot:COSAG04_NODE_9791_length_832_cov_0.830832_1_plen_137_part_10